MVGYLFTILLFSSCAYACVAGGKDGRWASFLLILAAILSLPASYLDYAWVHTQLPVFLVDVALLVGLGVIAFRSHHFWPLWATAFHFISVSTHAATIIEPSFRPIIYFALQSFWSLPLLLVMVAGIMLDRQARLPASAPERSGGYEPSRAP
ncbi:MAG: hypothetical protein ACOY45_04470 [Pseudomonadota bacterium]